MNEQRGFTLIELMVALVLFTFAVIGVLAVATRMSASVKEQRQVVQTETDVRAPMDYITDALRMASPSIQTGAIQDARPSTCVTVSTGFNGVGGLAVKDSTSGSDQLDVVFAAGASIGTLTASLSPGGSSVTIFNESNQAQQFSAGDTVMVSNTTQGTLFTVNGAPSGGTINLSAACSSWTAPTSGSYAPGSYLLRVQRARFSVQLVDNIPTLMMNPTPETPGNAQPLAEGIEDMQIAVGIDTDANYTIDQWEYASTSTNVTGVPRAVRITLTSRSDSALSGSVTVGNLKLVEDRAAGAADNFRRRYLTNTVELRNFGGSP